MSIHSRILLAAGLAGCAFAAAAAPLPRPQHIVVVIEENRSYGNVVGSPDAAYINQLASQGALLTQYFAITHPSEPNYVAMFSGDTQGVTDDSCPHSYKAPNLAEALLGAKFSFAIYSENMPAAGFTGCASQDKLYRRKHNPVPDFPAVPASTNRPFSDFPGDYSKLPTVSFVVPNMINDMHDGTAAQGDAWLKDKLEGYAKWALQHHSLLVLTWDEDDGAEGGHNRVMTVVLGQDVKPGHYETHLTHYDLLRTLTDMYGLKPIGHATEAHAIDGIWK
ncbi:MAG TPA: alkaline phosphatase family protein [Gammaproteobacteria bacterium]